MRPLALVLVLLPALAHAEPRKVDRPMVVLDFTAQDPARATVAQSVTTLVTAELQQRPGAKLVTSADVKQVLGVERQRQLMGCTESACIAELGGALGARYIVSGQVATLGKKTLLSAQIVDARDGHSVTRTVRTVDTDDELEPAARAIAGELADAAGLETLASAEGRGLNLDLKLGNTLPALTSAANTSIKTLNLRLDFELGYFVTDQTSPFLGASLSLAHGSSGETLRFIPVLLGVKHYFRPGAAVQPYVGGGLGLGFLAGELAGDGSTKFSFAFTGVAGVAWIPFRHVGFNAEASGNLSGVTLNGSGLLLAFNVDAGVLFLF